MQKRAFDRRAVLQGLAGLSAAPALTVASTTEAKAYDPGPSETRTRYRENSADVQAFYRTNGYETLKK
jgi:hypothetical protein